MFPVDALQVCCHNNANVSFFALDALRQLAMRFLEKDELSHFQFQKDFLKPFEFTMINNSNSDAKDMASLSVDYLILNRLDADDTFFPSAGPAMSSADDPGSLE
jgi:brefeldin A-inhibited guanine nucleotide-exchange protein